MAEQIYKVMLGFPLLARAESAEKLRARLKNMSLDDLIYEINDGIDMIGGTRTIETVEHVPDSEVEAELLSVGNDGTFFEDMDMGDEDDEGEGKDTD